MKTFRLGWGWLGLLLGACLPALGGPAVHAVNFAELKSLFAQPPRQYSSAPLWVWNDMLSDPEIRSSLRDLAGQHIRQVFVHPRPGLMTPYLGPAWFHFWKYALKEAKQLDMNIWIYDENSYPSGFAGGWVPELMPSSRGLGLAFHEVKSAPRWSDDLVGVYRLARNQATNVTERVHAGAMLPTGRYLVATVVHAPNAPWTAGRCYVNLLTPGVTQKFLEVTLDAYRREVGNQFGHRIPGVFSDEPNIRPTSGLPWCADLPAQFRRRWGYRLLNCLPSLTREVGDWRKVRHDYYSLLNTLFIDRWAKPYHDYCATNHLEWTGHYWDHEWPNCTAVPDNMAMYPWFQRPGIDCLMNEYAENTHAQFGNVRMVKELASVANQLGRPRTLCEAYGAGGWDLRFEDMKRIADWLGVLGVNTFDQHLSYLTIRGARKRDHPQSFSYQEPWWDGYHVQADYLARLSLALSTGEEVNPILVLEPTTTAWMYQGDAPKLKVIGDSFFNLLMRLERAQIEYDLGDEDIIARHGKVEEGRFVIGQRRYSVVVVPPDTENLDSRTSALLGEFSQTGTVIRCGAAPDRLDGAPSAELAMQAGLDHWQHVAPTNLVAVLRRATASAGFTIERDHGDRGILFHQRRHLRNGQLLFLVNTSLQHSSSGTVTTSAGGVEKLELNRGAIRPYPFAATTNGSQFTFHLTPCGSLLLYLSKARQPAFTRPVETVTSLKPIDPLYVKRLAPNVLTLDYVDVLAGGKTRTNLYCYQANQFVWQQNGMPRDPWDNAVQFSDDLIRQAFPIGSGFTASYRFTVQGPVPHNLSIVIERSDLYDVTCNGWPVKAHQDAWWLDRAFERIHIAAVAHTGENVITLQATPFTMFDELEPAYVLGNFSLKPAAHGFIIEPTHPLKLEMDPQHAAEGTNHDDQDQTVGAGWNQQGAPFYAAGVAYSHTYHIDKQPGRYVVRLGNWNGSMARVRINGDLAGYITAPPWELDVTEPLIDGNNLVTVEVVGTLRNTLGPHHDGPVQGRAWPAMFQQAPNPGPPPGDRYSTLAYGLFAPFQLLWCHPPPAVLPQRSR